MEASEPIELHAEPLPSNPSPEWARLLRMFRAELDQNRGLTLNVDMGLPLVAALVMALKLALREPDIRGDSRVALERFNHFLINQMKQRGLVATCAIAELGKLF